jgi:fructose-bisphosphate aldolase class I
MMDIEKLNRIATIMGAAPKGVLAADESTSTIGKRFASIGLDNVEDHRRAYRELLFRTPGFGSYISGVILYDETIRQKAADGTSMVDLIKAAGALPGIKVDMGTKPLPNAPGEVITEGLDGLDARLADYAKLGAAFTKWRAVINIGNHITSNYALKANAEALARYAALVQAAGMVPIVEPEVIMDGAHDIDTCFEVTEQALKLLYDSLWDHRVVLEGTVLKPNMVVSGTQHPRQAGVQEVAEKTLKVLKRRVPAAVPSVVFLSGGQSDEDATAHLSAMNAMGPLPWHLSFSYGRALQAAAIKTWAGRTENVAAGQKAFAHRAHMNGLAAQGKWTPADEVKAA